jgi:hypothetical protein
MSDYVGLLTLRPGTDAKAIRAAIMTICAPLADGPVIVEPTLAGGRNAGDMIVRLRLRPDANVPAPDFGLGQAIATADGAIFDLVASGGSSPGDGIYRTALFHAARDATPARRALFEAETIAMPRRMACISGWGAGRVVRSWGRMPWDYVWEQSYRRLEDLTVSYMRHPAHWGQVDRWFDPEHPDWLIDAGLCHAFCQSTRQPAWTEGS